MNVGDEGWVGGWSERLRKSSRKPPFRMKLVGKRSSLVGKMFLVGKVDCENLGVMRCFSYYDMLQISMGSRASAS